MPRHLLLSVSTLPYSSYSSSAVLQMESPWLVEHLDQQIQGTGPQDRCANQAGLTGRMFPQKAAKTSGVRLPSVSTQHNL